MKIINKIISSALMVALMFSLVIAIGATSAKADDSDFKIDSYGTLVKYSGEAPVVEIPDTVKTIGKKAFYSCHTITTVKMPNSVKVIENSAFESCVNLSKIVFSKKVDTIGDYAFFGCTSLGKLDLPQSITSIGVSAFSNCSALNGVYIPKNVKEIGNFAFGHVASGATYTREIDFTVMGEGLAADYASKYDFSYIKTSDLTVKTVSFKKSGKNKAKLVWKVNDKADKYQIQLSTTKNFAKRSTYTVNNKEVYSRFFPKLKAGNTYYVRIRGVKNLAGTTYTSKWSAAKTVKM